MNAFDAAWLQLREPFDIAARDASLASRFAAALAGTRRRIVDLAAGTGAAFRALAPIVEADQDWLLVDHDLALVAAQREAMRQWAARNDHHYAASSDGICIRAGDALWRARARVLDLATGPDSIDLALCDGVTTSAFLDLVSPEWIERLCGLLARHRLPLLATLSVDGRRVWRPALAADAAIERAFARHQSRDKGFGPALGARAAAHLAERLARHGYEVTLARSDWRIGADHPGMLLRMADEAARVAAETEPQSAALFVQWKAERHRQQKDAHLALEVGHLDLLALLV